MHPIDAREPQSFTYLNILTPDCYNHIYTLRTTRASSRDALHRRRTNRSPVFMPIISYHSTLFASPDDILDATQYFNSRASFITTYSQSDEASITATPVLTDVTAPTVSYELITAEPASEQIAVITTSHILLSRGVRDDPSLPTSSCNSPTQGKQEEDTPHNLLDFAVTTVWESTGKKVMTFGGAGATGVRKSTRSAGDELKGGAGQSRNPNRRSEEATRKASEWLGLVPKSKNGMSAPNFEAEKGLYER